MLVEFRGETCSLLLGYCYTRDNDQFKDAEPVIIPCNDFACAGLYMVVRRALLRAGVVEPEVWAGLEQEGGIDG